MAKRGVPINVSRRKPGNPNWGKALQPGTVQSVTPTRYEKLLKELSVDPADRVAIIKNSAVRTWVRKYYNSRYVPEWLLEVLGLKPDETFSGMA